MTALRLRDVAELGAKVRETRRELGLTQQRAAALCGVGSRFLSELERGKPTAELGKVLAVAAALGLDLWLSPRASRAALQRLTAAVAGQR